MQNVLLGISAFLMVTLFWSEMCYGYDAEGMRYSIKFTEHIQFLVFTFITAESGRISDEILAYTFTVYTLFPFVCIILHFLAIRYSWNDATDVIARDFHRKMGKSSKK